CGLAEWSWWSRARVVCRAGGCRIRSPPSSCRQLWQPLGSPDQRSRRHVPLRMEDLCTLPSRIDQSSRDTPFTYVENTIWMESTTTGLYRAPALRSSVASQRFPKLSGDPSWLEPPPLAAQTAAAARMAGVPLVRRPRASLSSPPC